MDIVISHPFSGALFAFFAEQATGEKIPSRVSHPYYRTLYGKNHEKVRDIAITQLLLYDKVFIVPADTHMPDYRTYSSGGKYENTALGLYSDWEVSSNSGDQIDAQVESDLRDSFVSSILSKVPHHSKRQILRDVRLEVALANELHCPILSAGGRSALIKRLAEIDAAPDRTSADSRELPKNLEQYLNIVGLSFHPTSYELLCEYKQDKELRGYAAGLKSVLSNLGASSNPRRDLLLLMRESINKEALMKKSTGALDVASIVLSIGGFIPVAGPFLSAGALAATAGGKYIGSQYSRTWYEFGPRIRRITEIKAIEKLISSELAEA